MKTKDLIKLLQEADPEGEIECCIGNCDIVGVDPMPAYWDGRLQIIERNKDGTAIGAKYTTKGSKIKICSLPISELIFDYPEIPINYSELGNDDCQKAYKEYDDRLREDAKDIYKISELRIFLEWFKETTYDITGSEDEWDLEVNAKQAFEDLNINRNNPFPEDIASLQLWDEKHKNWYHPSYVNKRKMQWDKELEVYYYEGELRIKRI